MLTLILQTKTHLKHFNDWNYQKSINTFSMPSICFEYHR